ncbi:LytTr DNA-binding domain-containing protein [Pelagibacterium luteolum]|uniref:LytTr DNA-binding domain-containing protein n=1 Tax=Pelagibacterium luteolum TaxID=440168 RepID=A0A1G7VD85_9HYPH|nr:LytTr DNA-binding domain-containing protein [Pelagibacterium luteolum]
MHTEWQVRQVDKFECASRDVEFVNEKPLQLALRELRAAYTDPIALAAMIGVGLIAGITGPFSTFEYLPLAPRLLYWMLIVFGTYSAGQIGASLTQKLVPQRCPLIVRIAALGLGASIPVTSCVVAISWLFVPDLRVTGLSLGELFLYCLLISLALIAVLEGVVVPQMARRQNQAAETPSAEKPPALLDRLPHAVRGQLSHLSMADHYVEVFTDKGRALVLMRLADAIAETEPVAGLQIHRSHWVAIAAIARLTRADGRPVIELTSGETLPVSRSYLEATRVALDTKKARP